jgi:hypothetical protein
MSGCELRARGAGLSTQYILSESAFSGAVVCETGFDLNLSESNDLQEQVSAAATFLREHTEQCRALADLLLPDAPILHFALWRKDGYSHAFMFPAALIRQAGAFGFEIQLSMFRAGDR